MRGMSRSDSHILLPVNYVFLIVSLCVAYILNLLPWGHWIGVPDFVALALIFWCIQQPTRVGMGVAFIMGVLVDVHNATFLGENALAYVILSFLTMTFSQHIKSFPLKRQIVHIFVLLLLARFFQMGIQYVVASRVGGWLSLFDCVTGAIIWPVIVQILLFPQRRTVDTEMDRPL